MTVSRTDPSTSPDPRISSLVLESMADGVFTLDEKGRITLWNPAMARISGYRAEEALGRGCGLLCFSHCLGKKSPTSFKECGIYEKGRVDAQEYVLRHKDGHDVPVLKSARLVRDENDRVIGVVETVTDLTELRTMQHQVAAVSRRLGELHQFGNIIGKSHVMRQVFDAIEAAAASEATVLVSGESGTGKELVAGAIHYNSIRAEMPMVTVNCSALSESLLESELFGHVRGSFTGAGRDRKGRFEEADGGTVFLDEIGEVSPLIQVKLLRVLQEREIERVGESKKRRIDIRIIAATHRDLFDRVRRGEFREDLYYRLKVFPIQVPPLRARKEDLPLLAGHFIGVQNKKTGKAIRSISAEAMRILMDCAWPGNVRELENAVEHAFVLCSDAEIDVFDLPVEIRQVEYRPFPSPDPAPAGAFRGRRERPTRESLLDLLRDCGWNKAEAARRMGMSRTAVWKYMKKYDIPLKADDR
ncbi:sigma-54 interaction domain-containing protein [Desulfococcus sp.]|uniref:sigma-54 interaction domain-containing protein n=1 Tax=Desulfococcus sp. TaxID=2025834 RepID=UPI003594172C